MHQPPVHPAADPVGAERGSLNKPVVLDPEFQPGFAMHLHLRKQQKPPCFPVHIQYPPEIDSIARVKLVRIGPSPVQPNASGKLVYETA